MITNSKEYEQYLAGIAGTVPSIITMIIPTDEPIYDIDLNARKITPPPFIGVKGDHRAEYIFFRMDRFYDLIDLSTSVGLVIFKNAKNEEFCQPIPYYDIYKEKDKIIFPWVIQAPAAWYDGQVTFSFKFYKTDPTIADDSVQSKLIYELNTQPAKTKVLVGWSKDNDIDQGQYQILDPQSILVDESILSTLSNLISIGQSNKLKLFWIDADALNYNISPNNGEYEDNIEPALPEDNG